MRPPPMPPGLAMISEEAPSSDPGQSRPSPTGRARSSASRHQVEDPLQMSAEATAGTSEAGRRVRRARSFTFWLSSMATSSDQSANQHRKDVERRVRERFRRGRRRRA